MSDRAKCIRCAREIDASARVCPFCNWDQNETPDARPKPSNASDYYVPPPDDRARRKLIGISAFVVLIIAAFLIGAIIHSFGPSEVKAAQTRGDASSPAPPPRASVTLVPVTDDSLPAASEWPATTVPPPASAQPGATTTAEPTDATAMPSDQYAAATARARAPRQETNPIVDPRSIAGSLPSQPRPSQPNRSSAPHTRPVAIDQPLPHVRVDRPSSARLLLTVGTDGRVHDISVLHAIPGEMGRVISAVQGWRFRPATQNGQPVTARLSVEIIFQP